MVSTNECLCHIRFYFRLACFTYFSPLLGVDKDCAILAYVSSCFIISVFPEIGILNINALKLKSRIEEFQFAKKQTDSLHHI